MKKLGTMTAVALVMSVTAAYADGLSLKDAPASSGWGGMYIGGTIGYGWGTSDTTLDRNDNHGFASNDQSGALAGVTAGYNYQINDRWVAGVEGDLSIADISGDEKRIWDGHLWYGGWGSLLTIRGRVGYDMNGNLIYATAGYAAGHSDEYILGNTRLKRQTTAVGIPVTSLVSVLSGSSANACPVRSSISTLVWGARAAKTGTMSPLRSITT